MKKYIKSSVNDKRDIDNSKPIFSMSKIRDDLANIERTGPIPEFIYFSEANSSHSPRIKFYGGTRETSSTFNCPSMLISKDRGAGRVELLDWHNKQNCPNGYDSDVIKLVSDFIDRNLPLLLLVWFRKLDEAYLLKYFDGSLSWKDTLNHVTDVSDKVFKEIMSSNSISELHRLCLDNDLYRF